MRFELMENKSIADRGPFFIYLAVLTYWQIILPFLIVTFWGVLLIYDSVADTEKADDAEEIVCDADDQLCEARRAVQGNNVANQYIGGISVLLLGFASIFLLLALNKIRWNNWRFKQTHLILMVLSYVFFSIWQYLTLLSSDLSDFAYYGLSALFLTHNGFAITAYIFLNISLNKFNLFYFISKYAKKDGQTLDPTRTDDFIQEIAESKADDETDLYQKDVYDMITIGKVSVPRMLDAFGQGIQGRF